jgi:SAM-dependent methyltransferase
MLPNKNSVAGSTLYSLSVQYDSDYGHHVDHLYIQKQNLEAVISTLPAAIQKDLHDYVHGENSETIKTFDYVKGKLFSNDHQAQTVSIEQDSFIRSPGGSIHIEPRVGRFYPAALYNSAKLKTGNRMTPFRIIHIDDKNLLVSTNHPLCDYDVSVTLELPQPETAEEFDLPATLDRAQIPAFLTGPAMQLRIADRTTDFFSDNPYKRTDEQADSEFYRTARNVDHLDKNALTQLQLVYSELLPPGSTVLDLMSSINSHIDDGLTLHKLVGLGMNREELEGNQRLDEIIVQDINQQQRLPFDDASFDIVICSLSIEYLTSPANVFSEITRILKPGGRFIVSFSNRCFPTKAIRVWNNLHDFERIGMVMEHFITSAGFGSINTCSYRGLPRATDDRHDLPLSDPVYIVWANRT